MTIYVVRHTKTVCDTGICYGHSDVALAASFDVEKKNVKQQLSDFSFFTVYSSPLFRCSTLAEYLADFSPILYDNKLKELNFGDWENRYWNDIIQTDEAHFWFENYVENPCPNGESYLQLINRVQLFLEEIQIKQENKPILIVTHAGVIRAMHVIFKNILPIDSFNIKIEYGAFFKFEIDIK